MSNNRPKRLVILGGGFAGLYAAMELENTLAQDPDVEITLVNRENFFLFTPTLHEVAASDLELTTIVNPLRKMLKRVNFFLGNAESIEFRRKESYCLSPLRPSPALAYLRSPRDCPRLDH